MRRIQEGPGEEGEVVMFGETTKGLYVSGWGSGPLDKSH